MPIDWDWNLGNIYFNTRGEPDDLGCEWVIDGTPDGWDSAEFRPSVGDIPFADGGDVGDGFDGPRLLHCTGAVRAPSVDAAEKSKRRLQQQVAAFARADGRFYGRLYEDDRPALFCTVRKNGKVTFPSRPGPLAVEFDFLLVAGDPRKYSVEPHSITVTSATRAGGAPFPWRFPVSFLPTASPQPAVSSNAGDVPAPYIAVFHGPLRNPVFVDKDDASQKIPLKVNIPVNRTITVDTLNETITDDSGQSVYTFYDDVTGTPLDELRIPASDGFGDPGACDWLLRGSGDGYVEITNHDVYS